MTSKEIDAKPAIDLSTNSWLKEIAFQLALLNEKQSGQFVYQSTTHGGTMTLAPRKPKQAK